MKFTLEIDTLHDSEGDVAKAIAFLESLGAEKEETRPRKTRTAQPEEPKPEEPKSEEPQQEEPQQEEPKSEEPQQEEPQQEEPQQEEPKSEEPQQEEPQQEEPQQEEPQQEEPSVDMTELRKKAVQILSTDSSILKGILAKYGVSAISGLPDEGKQEVLDVAI